MATSTVIISSRSSLPSRCSPRDEHAAAIRAKRRILPRKMFAHRPRALTRGKARQRCVVPETPKQYVKAGGVTDSVTYLSFCHTDLSCSNKRFCKLCPFIALFASTNFLLHACIGRTSFLHVCSCGCAKNGTHKGLRLRSSNKLQNSCKNLVLCFLVSAKRSICAIINSVRVCSTDMKITPHRVCLAFSDYAECWDGWIKKSFPRIRIERTYPSLLQALQGDLLLLRRPLAARSIPLSPCDRSIQRHASPYAHARGGGHLSGHP